MTSAPTRLRAVVDTNLFVSGIILKRGNPFRLLEAWRTGLFVLLVSDWQQAELEAVVRRPEIVRKYGVTQDDIAGLLRLLEMAAIRVSAEHALAVQVRDPKDEMILASAVAGNADYLVTGDANLLSLGAAPELGQLRIVNVVEFMTVLGRWTR